MDRAAFGQGRSGELVEIQPLGGGPRDCAFIPAPVPPDWKPSGDVWLLASDAHQAVGTLNGIGQTLPNPNLLLRPLQRREAIRSSSLEGTYTSPEDLLLFEIEPDTPLRKNLQASQHEVFNYSLSLCEGYRLLSEGRPLTINFIKCLHEKLLSGVRGREKLPGEYRPYQVHIGSDRRYMPPPAQHVVDLMSQLEMYVNRHDNDRLDPLIRSYIVHYQFEAIHPFADGNGRVGRLLLALTVYLWMNLTMPWLYMSAYFEKYKDEYIDHLFRVSTESAWEEWLLFCLRGTIQEADDAVRRCQALGRLRDEYQQKVAHSPRTASIIDSLLANGVKRITDVQQEFGVSYKTARSDIERLVKVDILEEIENRRPKAYYAPEIIGIAYGEDVGS